MGSLDQKRVKDKIEQKGMDSDDITEALSQLLSELSDEEAHNLFSDLTDEEIRHISVLATVGDDDDLTKQFLREFKILKVSKRRRGRKELVKIASAFSGVFETKNEGKMGKIRRTLGL